MLAANSLAHARAELGAGYPADHQEQRQHSVNEVVDGVGMSQPLVSKHLKVLREAGLVDVRIDGQRRWYRLRAEPFRELDEWLTPYRRMWSDSLDALGQHLDRNPQPKEQT